jgi:hypothetical protein
MKKLGKAKIDLDKELWTTEIGGSHFHMNRRRVDTRQDVKKFMGKYKRSMGEKRPTKRHADQREQFFKERTELIKQAHLFWTHVYQDIMKESFEAPIPLRLDHDFDHKSDWRYCLYKGNIYQFDKPDLDNEIMLQQINRYEGWDKPAEENQAS